MGPNQIDMNLWSDSRTGAKSGEVFFGRTVGQGQSQGKFFLVGRSDGDYLVGWSDCRTVGRRMADGGWRMDGSLYFALEPPLLYDPPKLFGKIMLCAIKK